MPEQSVEEMEPPTGDCLIARADARADSRAEG